MVRIIRKLIVCILSLCLILLSVPMQKYVQAATIPYLYNNQVRDLTIGGEPAGSLGLLATYTYWAQYEWWHYSSGDNKPGYWQCTMSDGSHHIIKDTEYDVWNDINYIADDKGFRLSQTVPIPNEVQTYIDKGGQVEVSVDKAGGYYYMQPKKMYKPGTAKYKIYNQGSTYYLDWEAIPQFVCDNTFSFTEKFSQFEKYGFVPVPDQIYGRNIYSMFDKKGKHIGEAYSTYTGEDLKLDYSMILNINGGIATGKNLQISTGSGNTKTVSSTNLKIGNGTFQNVGAIGVVFYYPIKVTYYKTYDTDPITDTVTIDNPITPGNVTNNTTPNASAVIKADNRGAEKFDVSKGIPSSEKLYVNVATKSFLENYKFSQLVNTAQYQYVADVTYHLSWQTWVQDYTTIYHGPGNPYSSQLTYCRDSDGDGKYDYCPGHTVPSGGHYEPHTDTQTGTYTYNINQDYAYWVIDNLDIYALEKAVVNNSALPGGTVTLTPNGYTAPTITEQHSDSPSVHITMPTTFSYNSGTGKYVKHQNYDVYLTGYSSVPDSAKGDYTSDANLAVANDPVKVKNDKLIINGTTIMDQTPCAFNTSPPATMPNPTAVGNNVLYKNNIKIDNTELNGVKTSSGTIYYTRIPTADIPAGPTEVTSPINNINTVTVHTPVVCNSAVLSDVTYNQMLHPDTNRASLVLGTASQVKLEAVGQHLNILGYGDRDYSQYVDAKYVQWPFDVYIGKNNTGQFVKAGTWYTVPSGKDIVDFYIPTWDNEGNYNINFKVAAMNAPNPNQNMQPNANLDINNYVATYTTPVQLSGRLYGFRITDITDYPLWQNVFRTGTNTANHTNNDYRVGTDDQNGNPLGINSLYTLPVLDGSHPQHKNSGALKTGYSFRFDLYSIGNYFNDTDCIQINPTFWYINKDGTGKQQVDIYYNEKINNKQNYFIKVGSSQDHSNTHYIKLCNPYRNVPDSEITNTCNALGLDKKTFINQDAKLGWYDGIVLSKPLRTFVGSTSNLPIGVSSKDALESIQHWYGEYWLPDQTFAAPKDYNVADYGRKNGLDGKKEPFWLKNGYIIVNFDITAVKNGNFSNPYLSYFNAPNCNMWEMEGFKYNKTDYYGTTYHLVDGDTVFYYANKHSSDDYQSGVTH